MKTSEVLRRARDLIADPARWTQHAFARDSRGRLVEPNDHCAHEWCALGAIHCAIGEPVEETFGLRSEAYVKATVALIRALREFTLREFGDGDWLVTAFNDGRIHGDVIAVFDLAIAQTERTERDE